MRLPICAFILLTACAGALANPITIQVLPASQNVNVGDPVTLTLQISGLGTGTAPSVGTFDIDVAFDPTLLSLTNTAFGTSLDIFGLGDIQIATPGTSTVNLFELSLDSDSDLNSLQPASFVLATLSFTALGNGISPVSLSVNALGDADGNSLSTILQDGSVTVGPSASTPEPATIFTLGGALAALGIYRRYRRAA